MLFPESRPIQQCIYKMKQHTEKNKEGKKKVLLSSPVWECSIVDQAENNM